MQEKIKIYLHGENTREIVEVDIDETCNTEEILIKFKAGHNVDESPFPYIVSIQTDDDDNDIHLGPVKHKGHIHCHRCEKIKTTVTYNGKIHVFEFEPSVTGKKVLKRSAHQFGITPNDSVGLQLKLPDNELLKATDHVGSFTKYPECSLSLSLTSKVNIQG